ncbi:MAG TPA: polysaccharide biosynthesis tyrosine autokinase [Thermomicrobiales bacterium]|jgi:polysaccharide biosynthesis transport protein|nr:polysaccharide biosynthesis tyrosine autokinase [Thermomicrobiales bacterium]
MHRNVPARSGWEIGDARFREVGFAGLPTMADTGEIDLRGFLRAVYRRKWMLIGTMVVTMGATLFWLSQATHYYDADVLIVVETRPSSIVKVDEKVPDTISDVSKVNTEVAVLESRGLASRVIRDLQLDRDPEFTDATPDTDQQADDTGAETPSGGFQGEVIRAVLAEALSSVRSFFVKAWAGVKGDNAPAPQQLPPEEQDSARALADSEGRDSAALLDQFLKRLTIEPVEGSRLIRIGFTSTDPSKAALIANTVVDEYMKSQLETKTEGARHVAEWLSDRLAELGKTVRTLEQNVQEQNTATGSNSLDIVSQRLAQINLQLIAAHAASAASQARYEQVRQVVQSGGNLDGLPEIISSPVIQALRAKHTELVGTLSEHLTIYGDNHPQILSLRAEITQIEEQLNRNIANILAGLRNQMESDKIHEATVRRDLESVSEDMIHLKESDAAIAQVAQKLQVNQGLYRNLLERYTEAVALRDNQQPDARIISPAQIPLRPSFPNVPRVIALSFVGSASLAVFILVIAERLRQKLDTVDSVERHVGLQILGAIPELPRLRRLASNPAGYLQRQPLSEFGGAFQRLRALLNLGTTREMPRTLLVTSGSAGEGKTTVALCLGIASALSGQKVLLVDCNFARPRVHRMVNVTNGRGLTDVLRGVAPLEETITRAAEYHLSILTIGRSPEGAIDLLNSGRIQELLDELKSTFDVIIIDSAPVHEVSNALALGCLAEKTILVTRREWTRHRDASYAAKQLQLSGADVAGVVFNRAES